jgi:hypothetical protein
VTREWLLAACLLAFTACGPQVQPELKGLRASVPLVTNDGETSEAVYRLEWTTAHPTWLLFRPWVPLQVRYWTFFGAPCGRQELGVTLREDFTWAKEAQQDVRASLDIPFWARSMTIQLGRSGLVVERDLSE